MFHSSPKKISKVKSRGSDHFTLKITKLVMVNKLGGNKQRAWFPLGCFGKNGPLQHSNIQPLYGLKYHASQSVEPVSDLGVS